MPYRLYLLWVGGRVIDAGQVQSSIGCALTVHTNGWDEAWESTQREFAIPFTVRFLGSSSLWFGHCPPERREECKGGMSFFSEGACATNVCERDYRIASVYFRYAFASEFYSMESLASQQSGFAPSVRDATFYLPCHIGAFDPGQGSGFIKMRVKQSSEVGDPGWHPLML